MSNSNKKKIIQEYEHEFVYSHIEYPPADSYTFRPPNKEVVICKKCGEIRKFFMNNQYVNVEKNIIFTEKSHQKNIDKNYRKPQKDIGIL